MINNSSDSLTGEIIKLEKTQKEELDLITLNSSMAEIDVRIHEILNILNLPTQNIVVEVSERSRVFKNLEDVINTITSNKDTMTYLSKFIYATANGLFDAALNYLWDATINELRARITNFDIEYFYNVTVTNTEKRNKLNGVDDLAKIQDADLLVGAHAIELIDSIGYRNLDHIRYMRNWASTAHPNEVTLSGLQLINWLETCIKSVFNIPYSSVNLEIKKLLTDIKMRRFPDAEVEAKKVFFIQLSSHQINSLLDGLFGIYVSEKTSVEARDNISKLVPSLWSFGSDETKVKTGTKYGNYSINGHTTKAQNARNFLEIVNGQAFIPQDLKISEITNILSDLKSANDNSDNFYTEPPLAKQLLQFISKYGDFPTIIEKEYISTLIYCFITNGNGVAWNAEDYYKSMINGLSNQQAIIALLSFTDESIINKLDKQFCVTKYKAMLDIIKPKLIQPITIDLATFLLEFPDSVYAKFTQDAKYKKQYEHFVESF